MKLATGWNSKKTREVDCLLLGETSERLIYRKLEPSDFQDWLPFFSDPTSSEYWSEETLHPEEACQKWFDKAFFRYRYNLGGMNALIHKETGVFIGQCGLLKQTVDGIDELEIGYSLLPEHRKKGYASEAAKKCKSFAFEHKLSNSLISLIHVDNKPSQRVALNNGMAWDKTTTYKNNPVHIYRVINK
ncbi:RimJ/RimL family protein N-acetyltransferase [Maribacter polysiphoniae]|uniref:RimJ/RimL family protein N-acetyltransferase n=1 Tax=Maribacter polysiphoniae TaxID=429344 RepID=A0A316E4A2_9FLAO|nr:RimJ/RimL family protein N-acetyltransferase [Maribacter polysiphoniae]